MAPSHCPSRNPVALAAVLSVSLLAAAPAAHAATPASGTATAAGDSLAWTGGPFTSANASTATCLEGVTRSGRWVRARRRTTW